MQKRFRSWFLWRFSLSRLVMAVVLLGVLLGLNMREIGPRPVGFTGGPFGRLEIDMVRYRGWPLCFEYNNRVYGNEKVRATLGTASIDKLEAYNAEYRWLPLTHQAYRLLDPHSYFEWNMFGGSSIFIATIDALFALTILFLLLFLQIPRRKAPEHVR